eukprot:gb/GEZN01001071.1/.p1 GENE.gb/GEZN01001071.1/~~gb/GEZN01001071.1/.p1  ORF type:complete len:1031 (+),score=146.60 gb/GEZN01001071.1/:242-3334(+)
MSHSIIAAAAPPQQISGKSGYGVLSLDNSGKLDIYATLHFMLHTEHSGVREFLAHRLYDLPDYDIDFVLPQLCNLVIKWPAADAKMLEKFLVHTCSVSVHLALKVIMQLEAIAAYGTPEATLRLESLLQRCETAVVNAVVLTNEHREEIFARVKTPGNGGSKSRSKTPASSKALFSQQNSDGTEGTEIKGSLQKVGRVSGEDDEDAKKGGISTIGLQLQIRDGEFHDEGPGALDRTPSGSEDCLSPKLLDSEYDMLLSKQIRSEYFNLELQLMSALSQIADALAPLTKEKRKEPLRKYIRHLDKEYVHGLYFPLADTEKPHYKILSVLPDESVALSSRDKAPYMVWLEIAPSGFRSGHPSIYHAFQDIQDLKRGYQSARKTRFKPYPMWQTWSEVHSILLPELKERIRKLACSEKVFISSPSLSRRQQNPDPNLLSFDLDLFYPLAMLAVKNDHLLAGMRDRLTPNRVSEEKFWRNYVSHVDRVRADLSVPSVLSHLPARKDKIPNGNSAGSASSHFSSSRRPPSLPSIETSSSSSSSDTIPLPSPESSPSEDDDPHPAHLSVAVPSGVNISPGKHAFPEAPWAGPAEAAGHADPLQLAASHRGVLAAPATSSSKMEGKTPQKARGAKSLGSGKSMSTNGLRSLEKDQRSLEKEHTPSKRKSMSANGLGTLEKEKTQSKQHNRTPSKHHNRQSSAELLHGHEYHALKVSASEPNVLNGYIPGVSPRTSKTLNRNLFQGQTPFGELYKDRRRRIAASSHYSSHDKWDLTSVIFKGGDDCRQEVLAMQLINLFDTIWKQAHIPLRLRSYGVLVTSATSGLIETVTNAASIDSLKKSTPNFESLHKFFEDYFAADPKVMRISDTSYEQARRNFIESMAAYSVVTYLLQVRDRHNGNIMLVEDGSIVHIDFGFMLSNSPGGNMNFESCAFKLTDEYVEVMSTEFHYFQLLTVRGFLEARKHAHKFITLVEVMQNSSMACFLAGDAAISALRQRFYLELSEKECVEKMMEMIEDSVNNWRSVQYDNYQRITNGIL